MKTAAKIITTFVFVILIRLVIGMTLFCIMPSPHELPLLLNALVTGLSIGGGILIWKKITFTATTLASYIVMGGIILGTIGFLIGFVGPIVFMPGANQGPLLGIFFTGPVGFILGLISGAVVWRVKKKKRSNEHVSVP